MSNATLYETDFHAWACEQAALLRRGELALADSGNIAEELEAMARRERRALRSRLAVLLAHLLRWRNQPGLRSNSWRLTIAEQRRAVAELLEDSPGLQAHVSTAMAKAYEDALLIAQRETGQPAHSFPVTCEWTFDAIMGDAL